MIDTIILDWAIILLGILAVGLLIMAYLATLWFTVWVIYKFLKWLLT